MRLPLVRSLRVRTLFAVFVLGCGAGTATTPPTAAEPDAPETVLRRHAEALCAAGPFIELGDTVAGRCDVVEIRTASDGDLGAAIADVTLGGQLWSVLAVEGGDELRVATLASGWSPGVGGHFVEGESAIETVDLVPGGDLEIHASFVGAAGDEDLGSCDFRGRETAVHVLCSADGGALRCVAIESTRLRTHDQHPCSELPYDGPIEVEASVREGWALAIALSPGSITLTPTPADTEAPPLAGELTAAELFAHDELAWPARFETIQLLAN